MQQPALGQKLLSLRQEKGLTQEELVEQCNISVRTIQRIEAGEVTPRAYTVKTILSALGEDFEGFTETKVESGLKKVFFLKIDDTQQANFLTRNLHIAWVAGIIYFILGFAEFPADAYRLFDDGHLYPMYIYIPLKLLVLLSLLFFLRGFILCGNILNNYLLKVIVFVFIALNIALYTFDIFSLFIESIDHNVVVIVESIVYGIVGLLMGVAMLRLKSALGNLAIITGVFEIVSYACLASVIFAAVGAILFVPTIILEVIVLYKVAQLVKEKQAAL